MDMTVREIELFYYACLYKFKLDSYTYSGAKKCVVDVACEQIFDISEADIEWVARRLMKAVDTDA